ncbi:MAG TPA: hypothetical protein VGH50_03875 [Candidatus Binatia bacterium]|jgi:hypothetical protein
MDYFRSYSLSADVGVVAAWESETARAMEIPSLARLIAERGAELYPEFAKRYAEVRALSRSARRALQRRLAASRDLAQIPAEWQRRLAYSIAGAALLLVLSDGPLQAGTINVGPGCTLVDAINSANNGSNSGSCTGATASPNTIVIPARSKIVFTKSDNYLYSATALPVVYGNITITGNGATISRSKKGSQFRFFAVTTSGDLTLNNLTLSGGISGGYGGAVANYGKLEINNCIISGNTAHAGAVATLPQATTTIAGTTFTKNVAYDGGALYNLGGEVSVQHSTITGNGATRRGGGVFNSYGEIQIQNSTLSKNTARYGGAIFNFKEGNVNIDPTIITGNKAAYGGGIENAYGYVYIASSTISKNSATGGGGGIDSVGLGATLTIKNSSSVTGNKGGSYGGGVFNCGVFNLNNSTITTNSAKVSGGGVFNISGTYGQHPCTAAFTNNGTVSGNKAKTDPDIVP